MQFVILYDPPAVGKLTVGKRLAELTGYKLFHNHLAIDLVHEVYDWGNPAFFPLVHTIRTSVLESAAVTGTNLILTFFYTGAENEKTFFGRAEELVHTSGGNVLFVRLTAPAEVLLKRVVVKSRKQFSKLTSRDALIKTLEANRDIEYDSPNQLTLDAARLQPEEMAQAIREAIA